MRRAGIKSQNAEAEDALSAQFVAPRSGAVMNKGAKCRERVQETQTIRSILPSPHETSLISLSLAARTRIAVSTFPKPWNLLLSFTAFNSNLRRTEQTEKYMGEQRAGEMEVDIEISSAAEVKRRCTSPKVILGQKFATKVAAAAKAFDFRFAVYNGCKDKIFLLSTSYFLPATG